MARRSRSIQEGGNGYGPSRERSLDLIEEDLENEKISIDGAERDYGLSRKRKEVQR